MGFCSHGLSSNSMCANFVMPWWCFLPPWRLCGAYTTVNPDSGSPLVWAILHFPDCCPPPPRSFFFCCCHQEFRATLHRRPDNHSHPQHRVGSLDGSLAGESRSRENLTSSRPPLASRLLSSSSSQQQGQRDVDVDDGDDDGDEISDVNEDDLNWPCKVGTICFVVS